MEVYWHLPGFYYFRLLNQVILNLMKDYPECFRGGVSDWLCLRLLSGGNLERRTHDVWHHRETGDEVGPGAV